jgi:viroplasmin and RNaseH domain-containing protein
MAKHKTKKYYAVARGKCYPAPGIFSSWYVFAGCSCEHLYSASKVSRRAEAQALVSGFKDNLYKGFQTLEEAIAYMEGKGVYLYSVSDKIPENEKGALKGEKFYYAVANGHEEGIYNCYY